jgi:hypothetical protein
MLSRDTWTNWQKRVREPSLTLLLVMQVLAIFVCLPMAASGVPFPPSIALGLLLTFIALVVIVSRTPGAVALGVVSFVAGVAGLILRERHRTLPTELFSAAAMLLAFGALCWVVGAAVAAPGRVTWHRIRGAIVLYLTLALIFSTLYRAIYVLQPGAFRGLPSVEERAAFTSAMLYFSFTTLTSTGFGDILPMDPLARGLANLEAIVGQLCPVILLGRIVTLELRDRRLVHRRRQNGVPRIHPSRSGGEAHPGRSQRDPGGPSDGDSGSP